MVSVASVAMKGRMPIRLTSTPLTHPPAQPVKSAIATAGATP